MLCLALVCGKTADYDHVLKDWFSLGNVLKAASSALKYHVLYLKIDSSVTCAFPKIG